MMTWEKSLKMLRWMAVDEWVTIVVIVCTVLVVRDTRKAKAKRCGILKIPLGIFAVSDLHKSDKSGSERSRYPWTVPIERRALVLSAIPSTQLVPVVHESSTASRTPDHCPAPLSTKGNQSAGSQNQARKVPLQYPNRQPTPPLHIPAET